ncbi:MAG: hypothetical protein HY529_05805 [Chloroflexi bacterium]|nr:hypothetical protein [Chloroflexota bacterium]
MSVHIKPKFTALAVLTLVVVIAFIRFGPFNFNLFSWKGAPLQTISATENDALWAKANTALAGFLGEGFKTFGQDSGQPATKQELALLSGYINDFSKAVKELKGVTPPSEQSIMHWALLPVYQEMLGPMAGIRDALLAGDPWAADLEWHKLALLLDEVGGTTEILTPETSSVAVATPEPTPTPTSTPTPTPTSTLPSAPAVPTLKSPLNGSLSSSLTPALEWQPSIGASYGLQIATDQRFSNIIIEVRGLKQASYIVPSSKLDSGKTYYWRVGVGTVEGKSGWSPSWSFVVLSAPTPAP